ncbi:Anti-sigma regulatory factor (Ser/Thr protein kinase) [Lentzea albidocapillata subsp. violacea]|uniref:Anti-sigma regulatory factor (Ser/Thr protein kinase) n=1 Tax=Lentzea albidocapillata subsp. violacea TaxID=128104 RepID=A0A1G8UWS9_9PSEU|nr:ATP-binding protein [Lentzea albidocapillata]SDJ58017.1 Anti-sigma regulatory factor (Ser/Thr protein kinase) [Lentzea albidocapillata subsp. violacea]
MDAPEVLSASARTLHTLPEDEPDLGAMRGWIGTLLRDLPEDVVLDVLLVCTELASNAYEHAEGPRTVRVQRHTDFIRVEVDDHTPAELPRLGQSRLGDTRGRGLVLIAQLSRCWGTRAFTGGKTLWAEVNA